MNPILLGKQIERGLEDLVRFNFQTNSEKFQGMVENFLQTPNSFLKGPWITIDLPFRDSSTTASPFPEIPLRFDPYLHQEKAFDRLRLPNPRSTLIATGTGSGKTEGYLWPILDMCRQKIGQAGIKAIIIYPMNALATDQARRIAKVIHKNSSLEGVRCGLYADEEPDIPSELMTKNEVITSRKQIRDYPPDILLTNYKMLDYLLLRSEDKKLWANNTTDTLQYLVVDELHTFDGAQGTDLALLIRRLKARLKTPRGHLVCVGSSATLGIDEQSKDLLISYAKDIFGEEFDRNCLITEERNDLQDEFGEIDYIDLPKPEKVVEVVHQGLERDQTTLVNEIAKLFFREQDLNLGSVQDDKKYSINDIEWRLNLGRLLWSHFLFQRVVEAIVQSGNAATVDKIVARLSEAKFLRPKWSQEQLMALVDAIVTLASWGKKQKSPESKALPLLNIRIQIWAREMGRMLALLPNSDEENQQHPAVLCHSDDLEEKEANRALPVVICRNCGFTGQACRLNERHYNQLWETPDILYAEWFDKSDQIRILFYEPISIRQSKKDKRRVVEVKVDPRTLEYSTDKEQQNSKNFLNAWLYDPIDDRTVEQTCPSCGTENGLLILGLRTARLSAGLTTTLFNSEHHVEDDFKPRVLMFSDSVQDAAQRAAVNEIRNKRLVVEKTIFKFVDAQPEKELKLNELLSGLIDQELTICGDAFFVAKHVASQQTWRDAYKKLTFVEDQADYSENYFVKDVAKRLEYDIFANLTFQSRTGQTLETSNLCVADVPPNKLLDPSEEFQHKLQVKFGEDFYIDEHNAFSFLYGLVIQMRRNGAVDYKYIRLATEGANRRKGLDFTGANYRLKSGKGGFLPRPDGFKALTPVIPVSKTLKILKGTNSRAFRQFRYVGGEQRSNWYGAWVNKFFQQIDIPYKDLFDIAYEVLQKGQIVKKIDTNFETHGSDKIPAWLLKLDSVTVTTNVETFRCDKCDRKECFPKYEYSSLRCLKIGCEGFMQSAERDFEDSTSITNTAIATDYSRYYRNILSTRKNHRVVAREHTGLLEADERRSLEDKFKYGEQPWHPNLISATPTLELGIDIGDLSTLILASVPPDVANYVQRIGRTGRRDGSSLNITLVAARSHDLQFWEDPNPMLKGQITPPGLYLEAIAILQRQVAAFSLDRFVAETEMEFGKGKVKGAIKSIDDRNYTEFPYTWFAHLDQYATEIAGDFIELLPDSVKQQESIRIAITEFLQGLDHSKNRGLKINVIDAFSNIKEEKTELQNVRKILSNQYNKLKSTKPEPRDLVDQLKRLQKRRSEISKTIKNTIDEVPILKFLSDRGILPNYSFPEEGVKLKSIILREREQTEKVDFNENDILVREYQRPAYLALTELAPAQTFYAEGREVTIDCLDLRVEDIKPWRFCQSCNYSEPNSTGESKLVCPKCKDELWSDSGSCGEVVELKSVVANTSEERARIRDNDGRFQRQYDTEMVPNDDDVDVDKAYILEKSEKPFGIEFISHCNFRHFNFGERAASNSKKRIAGRERSFRAIKICRYCGTLQKNGHSDEGRTSHWKHQVGCQGEDIECNPDDWQTSVYLINTFSTEALRMIVPVPGEANFDEIKSFVAGVELGLRRYFRGRVDHIRSTVINDRLKNGATVRNLFFYDTIPGGSSYLRQLAQDPNSLWEVFDYASKALRQCPCNGDESKNGCFRCVKPYRSQFGRGEPKRDTALELIEAVLTNWDSLKEVKTSINKDLGPSILESVLEEKFLHFLREKYGSDSLKSIVLGNGRRGFQLKVKLPDSNLKSEKEEVGVEPQRINDDNGKVSKASPLSQNPNSSTETKTLVSEEVGSIDTSESDPNINLYEEEPLYTGDDSSEQEANNADVIKKPKENFIYWTIEPQVQIEKKFPELPKKRVDFLISSSHRIAGKPIVVELDGFRYHYDTIKDDVENRLRMIKSGQVEVWTILWDDLERDPAEFNNPFSKAVETKQFSEALNKLFKDSQSSEVKHLKTSVDIVRKEKSINGLIAILECQNWHPAEACSLLSRIRLPNEQSSATFKELDDDSLMFLQEAENNFLLADDSLKLFVGLPNSPFTSIINKVDKIRLILQANIEEVDEENTDYKEFKKTWISLWRAINFLQAIRGFHVVVPGLDTLDPTITPDNKQIVSVHTNALWKEVFSLIDEDVVDTVKSLSKANIVPPDSVGADLMEGNSVACTIELGWSRKKFAIAFEEASVDGWRILEYVDPNAAGYADFIQKIIDAVSGDDQ